MENDMKVIAAASYTGNRPWDALPIAEIEGATIRLHWTDKPYIWHTNDEDEVFVVLEGNVSMRYRGANGKEEQCILVPGDICYIPKGDEHVAEPLDGSARILVIEKKGSI